MNIKEFKNTLSHFASGVTIVTCRNKLNQYHGVTISSFTSLSLEPTLILFCLKKTAHCFKYFAEANSFAVSILSESQQELARYFAMAEEAHNWSEVDYSIKRYNPIINGAIAYVECEKHMMYSGGDHEIFIAKVVEVEVLSQDKPLVYYSRGFHSI